MLACWSTATTLHRRHAVQGLGRRRARAGQHGLRGPQALDHGHADGAAARDRHPARPHRPDDGRRGVEGNTFVRVWRGLDPEGDEQCTAFGEPATLVLWATTTTAATRRGCAGPTAATTSCRARRSSANVDGVSHEPREEEAAASQLTDPADLEPRRGRRRDRACRMFWERGSLIATAVTPIIVAIVSEALNQPGQGDHVGHAARDAPQRDRAPPCARSSRRASARAARARSRSAAGAPRTIRSACASRRRASAPPLPVASSTIITGLLAAVIGAGVVTASELAIFGHSGRQPRARDRAARRQLEPAPAATRRRRRRRRRPRPRPRPRTKRRRRPRRRPPRRPRPRPRRRRPRRRPSVTPQTAQPTPTVAAHRGDARPPTP